MTYPSEASDYRAPGRLMVFLVALALCWAIASSAQVRINEVMAENDGGLQDSDGESPDWIELFNTSTNLVDLTGWRLTDTSTNLARWTFPATNIAARGYLVIFASAKDRALAGAELHTNFRLQNAGQYVALVQPNGTVASAISPGYPEQKRLASYGVGKTMPFQTLVSTQAVGKYLVPASSVSSWTSRTFNDNSWAAITNGFGFDTVQTNATNTAITLALDFNDRTNVANQVMPGWSNFVINTNGSAWASQTAPSTLSFGTIGVTISNTTSSGYDDRYRGSPGDSSTFTEGRLLRDFVMSLTSSSTGGLEVVITGLPPAQVFQGTIWSFDSSTAGGPRSDWYANSVLVKDNYTFDSTVLPWYNEDYRFSFETASTPAGALNISGRRDASSPVGASVFLNALRLVRTGYRAQFASDIQAKMSGSNATVYVRFPFNVTSTAAHTNILLRARYDDGFAAWINGTKLASRNAPSSPSWNSAATGSHPGTIWEDIPLTLPGNLLVSGANVLAIQLLNAHATNTACYGQFELVSYGDETPDRYLSPPTPGGPNGPGLLGFVADTKFSVDRGFQSAPFSLSITSATPGVSIYWTTNGTIPGPTNGTLYSSPLWISGNTFVRARAFATDLVPTESETHTYLFMDQVLQQAEVQPGYPTTWQASYPADYGMDPNVVYHPVYGQTISNDLRTLPILSLVAPHDDFWGTYGIYRDATKSDWRYERAASVELFDDNGTEFAVNCGVEMQGNASRDNARTPKHSFRLSFKSSYGPSKLNYDWFPGPVSQFDTIVLRAMGFVDAWSTRYSDTSPVPGTSLMGLRYRPESATYLKDAWTKKSFQDMGHFAARSDFVHLFLNGLYWGVYNPSERMEASTFVEHFGGRLMDWDVMAGDDTYNFAEVRDGNKVDWNALLALVNAGITNRANYEAVLDQIDVVSLIDNMMLHAFMEAEDWPFHNWYAAHRRATNGLPATKWIFLPWDQEIGMDRFVRRDKINVDSADTPARIYNRLRSWPEFRLLYGDRVQKHLFNGGALTASNNILRFQDLAAKIHHGLVGESARWGDAREFTIGANPGTGITFTRDEWWVPELQALYDQWFTGMTEFYIQRFRTNGLYPWIGAPEFTQFGGNVPAGFLLTMSHTNSSGTIFFTTDGSDPREYASGAIAATAFAYADPVPVNAPTLIKARVLQGADWSALVETTFYPPQDFSTLSLTEIMYQPPGLGSTNSDDFEFVELKNSGTNTLNLSGLQFTEGVTFVFTNGALLGPGEFAVLARDAAVFASRYPTVVLAGTYTGRLDNAGEELTLSHATGTAIFSVSYNDRAPWPVTADGMGYSIVPVSPGSSQAPDDGSKWRASSSVLGSPGQDDPAPIIPPVVITEILPHTDLPLLDTVELYNPTPTNVNIGGWFITDDPSVPKKFRIANGTSLPPNGYLAFNATQMAPVAFSEFGDSVYLFSGDTATNLTGYSYGVSFQASDNAVSFGRHLNSQGDVTYPAQSSRTLGTNNAGPFVPEIVITEINYHPASGGAEFIELFNRGATSLPLYHPLAPTNRWQISGIGFSFPPGTILDPGSFLVIVATNETAFRSIYQVPVGVAVLGPWSGTLQDSGERIQLERPTDPDPTGSGWIIVESVRYNDKLPWPPAADGTGASLHRANHSTYADEPLNWYAAAHSPGKPASAPDTDADQMPNEWENLYGLDPLTAAPPGTDTDGDGLTDLQEYLAGTSPVDPASVLRLVSDTSLTGIKLSFFVGSNVVSRLETCLELSAGGWSEVTTWPAASTNRVLEWQTAPGQPAAYFRVRCER